MKDTILPGNPQPGLSAPGPQRNDTRLRVVSANFHQIDVVYLVGQHFYIARQNKGTLDGVSYFNVFVSVHLYL